jgi:hypothetical protein
MPISAGSYTLPTNAFAQPVANARVTATAAEETLGDIETALDALVDGTGIASGVITTTHLGGDITTAGKALLDDANAAAQRTTLGLGTAAVAATGDFAAASHTHIATAISDSTSTGRSVLTAADASAARTAISAAASTHTHAGADITSGTVDIAYLPEATTAQFRANTADKVLSTDQVWAAAAFVTLTDAATIAVDMSAGINFTVTLGGNRTLGAPSNTKAGQAGTILVYQDGTGGRTLAFNAVYKFASGSAFSIDTTASRLSVLSYLVIDSSNIVLSGLAGVR